MSIGRIASTMGYGEGSVSDPSFDKWPYAEVHSIPARAERLRRSGVKIDTASPRALKFGVVSEVFSRSVFTEAL
jgi:hypothetical protein